MAIDFTQLGQAVLGIIKGLFNQIHNVASAIYPDNPQLVMLIGAIITIYFLKDKISNIAMYVVAGLILYLFVTGGLIA